MGESYITCREENGSINISEDVVASMVRAAVTEIDGVAGLSNTAGGEIAELKARLLSVTASYHQAASDFTAISNSFFWRLTGPARRMVLSVQEKTKNHDKMYIATRTTKALIQKGPKGAAQRIRYALRKRFSRVRARLIYCPALDHCGKFFFWNFADLRLKSHGVALAKAKAH